MSNDVYGDGTVFRGVRSEDSNTPTYSWHDLARAKGVPCIVTNAMLIFEQKHIALVEKCAALEAALQAAIDAPEPEPVAWRYRTKADWSSNWSNWVPCSQEQYNDYVKTSTLHDWTYDAQALYTHPPAVREPLSDAEIDAAWRSVDYQASYDQFRRDVGRAIEAAHGIKS